ncbi:MAG: sigma-E processing peptidase SpoIIGA [Halanaerobiales bacterium]
MILYLDLFFLNNTLMSFLILWAVGKSLGLSYSFFSLLKASLLATVYTFVYYWLNLTLKEINILFYISLNIVTAFLMIKLAFKIKIKSNNFYKSFFMLYLVTFAAVGGSSSLFYIFNSTPYLTTGILLAITIIAFIGQYSWHYFHTRLSLSKYYLTILIEIDTKKIELIALVDTGNKLRDPISKKPVIIIEEEKFIQFISSAKSFINGDLSTKVEILQEEGWSRRIKLLPCSTVGQENNLILGVKSDKIQIKDCKKKSFEKAVIGLADMNLDKSDSYQALLHPEVVDLIRGS